MPEFGFLSRDAEGCINLVSVVAAVVDEVEITVVELTVNEFETDVAFGLGVIEIRFYVECVEDFAVVLAGVDGASSNLVSAASVAEEIVIQFLKFGLAVGEARVI